MAGPKPRKPRLALIGSDSLRGKEILSVLSAKRFPHASFEFYDPDVEQEYSKLSQFRDEPKVVHALTPEALEGLDLVFLAADAKTNREYGRLAAGKDFQALDLAETFNADEAVPLIVSGINDGALKDKPPLIANPNPATIVLAHLLHALRAGFGLARAVAFVLQPASAYAEEGIQELADQSAALLSSSAMSRKVFPGQVAFNILSRTEKPDRNGLSPLENRVLAEVRRVLGPTEVPLALSIVLAPVFHTNSIMVHVEVERPASTADLEACLAADDVFSLSGGPDAMSVSPATAAGKDRVLVDRVRKDPSLARGFWIWTVADNLTVGSALNAYGIAKTLFAEDRGGLP